MESKVFPTTTLTGPLLFLGTGWDLMTGFSFPAEESKRGRDVSDERPRTLAALAAVWEGGASHAGRLAHPLVPWFPRIFYIPSPCKGRRGYR